MYKLLLLIFFLGLFMNTNGYTNYVDYKKPFKNPIISCPQNYSTNFDRILEQPTTIQPFGYTSSEFIDKIRFIQTDIPLPTNADFFL